MLDIETDTRGNLVMKADQDGIEHLEAYRAERSTASLWCDLLESYSCNGSFALIPPEAIGALTDAPIVAESVDHLDNGDCVPIGRVWWFPDYAVTDELETLEQGESITFKLAD